MIDLEKPVLDYNKPSRKSRISSTRGYSKAFFLGLAALAILITIIFIPPPIQTGAGHNEKSHPEKLSFDLDSPEAKQLGNSLASIIQTGSAIRSLNSKEILHRAEETKFWKGAYDFPVSPTQRQPVEGEVPVDYWDDSTGNICSTDCVPLESEEAWPIKPFDQPHSIIGGLNDSRPGSYHHGVDIMAHDFQKVYALQPGTAHIIEASGDDARVQVGNYIYWHITPSILEGEYVDPLKTVVGRVQKDFGHVHLSETEASGNYLNPLRPGQVILPGYTDKEPPVLGETLINTDGSIETKAYDKQSFIKRKPYVTPPIGLAALAYRMVPVETKAPITVEEIEAYPVQFSLTGTTNHTGESLGSTYVYPGITKFDTTLCYSKKQRCPFSWTYWTGTAPSTSDLYRLSVYAYDWESNIAVRDYYYENVAGVWSRA